MENFTVCIGRSFGSRGAEIGRELAKALDIPFYDKEIIEEQVKKSGFTSEYLSAFDEKKNSSFLYSIFMNPETIMLGGGYNSGQPMDITVLKVQCQVIRDIAAAGPCVIVGRRADQILSEEKNKLSVFVNADLEARIAHVSERDSLSRREAENKIKRMDRSRKSYYNFYGDGQWGEASNYDLCITSSLLGIEGSVEIIKNHLKLQGLI